MILATINGFALLLALLVAFLALLAGIAIGYEWGREAGIDEADDKMAEARLETPWCKELRELLAQLATHIEREVPEVKETYAQQED